MAEAMGWKTKRCVRRSRLRGIERQNGGLAMVVVGVREAGLAKSDWDVRNARSFAEQSRIVGSSFFTSPSCGCGSTATDRDLHSPGRAGVPHSVFTQQVPLAT